MVLTLGTTGVPWGPSVIRTTVMLAIGPIAAVAQMRPPVPNRPPPSSPGSARTRGPSWNVLETEPEMSDTLRPGAGVRVRPAPEPSPFAPPVVPRYINPSTGSPVPTIGPPSSAPQPECFPVESSATPVILRPAYQPSPGFPTSVGPAVVVPRVQPPGAREAGIPFNAPWTPSAAQTYGAGPQPSAPPVIAPRVAPTFDPIGCPTCGNAVQRREDAIGIGPNGRLHFEGPVAPSPGGLPMPGGGLRHSYGRCIGCDTTRDHAVSVPGEIDPAPQMARRADTVRRLESNCPTGVCTRVIHGESAVQSHTGPTYYGTAAACLTCGASSLSVHEGAGPQPVRAYGLPAMPVRAGHMADPGTANQAAYGATRALQEAARGR